MTSSDVIVSWPAEAAVADWPQVKPVSPSFSSLDKMELPSGPKSHCFYGRRLPGQLQPRNCCFGLHIVVWAPGTRTCSGLQTLLGRGRGRQSPFFRLLLHFHTIGLIIASLPPFILISYTANDAQS